MDGHVAPLVREPVAEATATVSNPVDFLVPGVMAQTDTQA